MISKDSTLPESSSSSEPSSDLEDLEQTLDDADALNRSMEISDKFSDCYVNIKSSHPEKEKQNKEIYGLTDSDTTKVDTIDHNFVPYPEDTVDGVYAGNSGNYTADDENEPDIVKSTKTRTPPNTLPTYTQPSPQFTQQASQPSPQSSPSVEQIVSSLPKIRIQTDVLTKANMGTSSLRVEIPSTSSQQVPEAVVIPPSPTFQQPVAPPRRKKKQKMSSSSSTTSQVEELTVSNLSSCRITLIKHLMAYSLYGQHFDIIHFDQDMSYTFVSRAFSDLFGKFLVPMKFGKKCDFGKNTTILGKK